MRPHPRRRRTRLVPALTVAMAVSVALTACTRSADERETGGSEPAVTAAGASPATAAAGDFGDLRGVCGPGPASGGGGSNGSGGGAAGGASVRGVTDSEITIGTTADVGSNITPGLGQEFFDVGDAFVAWCNKAGGINGRKLRLIKHDAKLSEAAAQMIQACQTDFMIVGGGMVGDAAAVGPRVDCGLGQISGYTVSPEAIRAPLQVVPIPAPFDQYPIGAYRQLVKRYPDAADHLGVAGNNLATLRPQGLRLREALTTNGFGVSSYQEWPPLVANYRPYMEEMRAKGTRGLEAIALQDLTAPLTAINNIGWKPDFVVIAHQLYDPGTIKAVTTANFSNVYLTLDHVPFELADTVPAVKEAVTILRDTHPEAKLTDFTAIGFNAWLLWAKAATECGADLTTACVLEKAGATKQWSAGGLYPAHDIAPGGKGDLSTCVLLMKVTPDGFVYDRELTQPNNGIFNCDPSNVARLTNTFE
ncbi:ABC-type branched-chain amino acid transport system, substrate-binding protein [Parafrankia irregularis]|uniref:ABC-type branched-chain amino acid transport system, substrate-binding protein n=1 Tax=Parafrankia irregularis TaxID=795642 RepID=A0A0S4QM27_9ACTN|nr:ABC transporter substrate-binding protein [Parafrankia sp. CH37]CUU56095.1 ABC-type branched-chain amino acid transport system, substrate-binding protein [Parafrankia irregularis]